MTRRAPASMRTRETLSSLIDGRLSSPDGRSELARLAKRLISEEALEAETRDALGRDCYERGAEDGRGCRNGRRTGRLKTAEGAIGFGAARARDGRSGTEATAAPAILFEAVRPDVSARLVACDAQALAAPGLQVDVALRRLRRGAVAIQASGPLAD